MAEHSVRASRIAAFIDFENLALGVKDAKYDKFRLDLVLDRLVEKGKVIFKRAYCDWTRYRTYKDQFHEASIELFDIPKKRIGGKNSADIRMVVDALDMAHTHSHVDSFALLSGDSDFSPLVTKLAELDKYVIGLGVKNSTADLLVNVCDEFICYDDLIKDHKSRKRIKSSAPPAGDNKAAKDNNNKGNKPEAELWDLMLDAIEALDRENYDVLWGSMVKQQIKRKKPSFSERSYGFRTFTAALEAAKKASVIDLQRDPRSGTYMVQESPG